jgi:hypothetical protein
MEKKYRKKICSKNFEKFRKRTTSIYHSYVKMTVQSVQLESVAVKKVAKKGNNFFLHMSAISTS